MLKEPSTGRYKVGKLLLYCPICVCTQKYQTIKGSRKSILFGTKLWSRSWIGLWDHFRVSAKFSRFSYQNLIRAASRVFCIVHWPGWPSSPCLQKERIQVSAAACHFQTRHQRTLSLGCLSDRSHFYPYFWSEMNCIKQTLGSCSFVNVTALNGSVLSDRRQFAL